MLDGLQMASPRSHRSHVGAMKLAMTDLADTSGIEESFEAEQMDLDVYSHRELVHYQLAALKELMLMTQPQKHVSAFKTDEIAQVMAEEAGRFDAVAQQQERGVRSTVGGIPAEYADKLTHLHFVNQPAGLRRLAEEAQSS